MENEIIDKRSFIEKSKDIFIKKKKILLFILFFTILFLSVIVFLNYSQKNKNEKISEQFIRAGIYLASNENEKSKLIYKDIIFSKNKFYSLLSLNSIIENDLEKNSDEILKLFKIVENINISKEQKNLIKLKKALYLKKISKDTEGNKLLKEIIADNSIWKEAAIEISK
tara:strand:- start:2126 stop:2632 length:507 start_codon:yes stop_codon:yes gene_type:complete